MKNLLYVLLLLPITVFGQQTFSTTTAKTYASAITDTVYFYAPAALGRANVQIGRQPVSSDTTTGTATPPPFVFTSDAIDLTTRQLNGAGSNSDSTWIKAKPLDAAGRIVHNDSLNISGSAAIIDVYVGSRVAGYSLNFVKIDAPYGVAIIHQIGGIVAAAIRLEYTVTWRAITATKQ